MCSTTNTAAGRSPGSERASVTSGSTPPADAPTTMRSRVRPDIQHPLLAIGRGGCRAALARRTVLAFRQAVTAIAIALLDLAARGTQETRLAGGGDGLEAR